jgi:hypothetical protein
VAVVLGIEDRSPVNLLMPMIDSLAGALDETADTMADVIRAELPEYRRFPTEDKEREWLGGLRSTLELFVDVARSNRKLTAEERSVIAAIGETRADQGVPLDVVLASVRIAMHVALCAVRRLAVDNRDAFGFEEALEHMSLRMTRFVNDFSTSLNRGYTARSVAQATSRERDRARFGSDVLAGAYDTFDEIAVQGEAVGFAIPPTTGFVVVPISGPSHGRLATELGQAVPGALVVPISGGSPHTVLIVPAATDREWTRTKSRVAEVVTRHRLTAVLVAPCDGPSEWRMGYRAAAASVGLVSEFAAKRAVVGAEELTPAQLVVNGPSAALDAIEREVLVPLRRHPRKATKLQAALDALMRLNGSAKEAARDLGVTADTVRTYKATIEELTGLCFDYPADALRLGLAWLLLRLRGRDRLGKTTKTPVEGGFSG